MPVLVAGGCAIFAFPASASTINFSGYTWTVKSGVGLGPGPNTWSNSSRSVYTDGKGRLHLKVRKIAGVWNSSEVFLPSSLGYGRYDFYIDSRVDREDPSLVAAPFIYANDSNEFDIEWSKWKNTFATTTDDFAVQPSNVSYFRDVLTNATSLDTIDWSATSVTFIVSQNGVVKHEQVYTGASNFAPGSEAVHINHWMFQGTPPQDKRRDHDLIIKSFVFTP